MDPIGRDEQRAIDYLTKRGAIVSHLPSGKVDVEFRKKGYVIIYPTRTEFVNEVLDERAKRQ